MNNNQNRNWVNLSKYQSIDLTENQLINFVLYYFDYRPID